MTKYLKSLVIAAVAVFPLMVSGNEFIDPLGSVKIAFLQSNDPNEQEKAAMEFFHYAYPWAKVITPVDVISGGINDYSCVWIHCDRAGLVKGSENILEYYKPDESDVEALGVDFLDALTKYSKDGGALYLSGQATQIVEAMGRITPDWTVNIYGNNANTVSLTDTWYVRNVTYHKADGELEGGAWSHAGHCIYGANDAECKQYPSLYCPLVDGETNRYPVLGPEGSEPLKVDDNNCMWNYNATDFRHANNAQILGTWGHGDDMAQTQDGVTMNLGIVEFLPDNAAQKFPYEKHDWNGNIIANGMAAFEWAPEGENKYAENIKRLTFNALNYLAKDYTTGPLSGVESAVTGGDSPVYYFNLQGVAVDATRLVPGVYVERAGNKTRKILVK